jgi:hypothetical protein
MIISELCFKSFWSRIIHFNKNKAQKHTMSDISSGSGRFPCGSNFPHPLISNVLTWRKHKFCVNRKYISNRSLVNSMVIDAKLGRKDYGSIPQTAIGRRLKPLDARTLVGRILMVKIKKESIFLDNTCYPKYIFKYICSYPRELTQIESKISHLFI